MNNILRKPVQAHKRARRVEAIRITKKSIASRIAWLNASIASLEQQDDNDTAKTLCMSYRYEVKSLIDLAKIFKSWEV